MASLEAKAEAVRATVSSTATCTPATVVSVKELLLAEVEPISTTAAKTTKPASRSTKTTTAAAGRTKKPAAPQAADQLSSRDRTALATHVINAAIKSLTEAAKPPPPPPPAPSTPFKQASSGDLRQGSAKRTLRRSTSAPLSPLQPRALNRVATSPSITTKPSTKQTTPSHSTGCLATVECARVAFAALRSIKGPIQAGQTDFQLENGMSALVGKLLALGMHDQALKELRLLKRRFDAPATSKPTKAARPETSSADAVAELLNFSVPVASPALPTITTCQIQVLKLIAAIKKPAYIEAVLPFLRQTHESSPVNLLALLAAEGSKEAVKAARQMANLSQIILSLSPSVSSQEDTNAMEPRLSPAPIVAFELQTLAFQMQFKWWKLAAHAGKADDEVLSPFLRCLKAFTRRHTTDDVLAHKTAKAAFEQILQLIDSQKHTTDTSSNSPTSTIYLILGTTAYAAKRYDESAEWFTKLRATIESPENCAVRHAHISARLFASALKATKASCDLEQLSQQVLDSLEGSLSGTISELNELLESLSLARRSAVGRLMDIIGPNSTAKRTPSNFEQLLTNFVLRYPHFVRRWMGNPPGKDASPKAILQFDQRRQLVMKSINQTLDATLMIVKCDLQTETGEWKQLDEVLQHCSSLLDTLSDQPLSAPRSEQLGTYYVKISSLYFSKFSQLRRQANRSKEENKHLLQTLSRSIDVIKERSPAEKDKAQLSTKLEVFADLCKSAGRTDDAVRTLRSICTSMAEDGVMKDVASVLAAEAPAAAWTMNSKASMLSRTLRQIAKLDKSWTDWTFFMPESERAAVLEHLVHLSSPASSKSMPLRLQDSNLTALLRIYSVDKYPIRRLRVLLQVALQNIGDEDEVDEAMALVEQALRQAQGNDISEDVSLAKFVPHYTASYGCIQAIVAADASPSIPALAESISTWESLLQTCTTKEDVYKKVDDPEGLIDHLQSMGQLVNLRGENILQLRISQLLVGVSKIFAGQAHTTSSALIIRQSQLAAQFIGTGSYTRALATLEQAKSQMEELGEQPPAVTIAYNLSRAEYLAGIGSADDALACLSIVNSISRHSQTTWATSKAHATLTVSMASLLQSMVALQYGDVQDALNQVKQSVRLLSHDWTKLESAIAANDSVVSDTSTDALQLKDSKPRVGPSFWALASPLVRSLLQISSVYAHIGMFQETIYYAETAAKIAENSRSSLYKAEVASWIGSIQARAGRPEEALAKFEELAIMMPAEISSAKARFAQMLGDFYSQTGVDDKALDYFSLAEETTRALGGVSGPEASASSEEPAPAAPTNASSRATKTTRTRAPTATRAPKRGVAVAKAKPATPAPTNAVPSDIYQASLLASVILSKATSLVRQKDWTSAMALLKQIKELPKRSATCYEEQVATAMSLIGHSMEQIISDPVFSVIQDSTISFPAVSGLLERANDVNSPCKSPPKRGRAAGSARKAVKESDMPAFAEALREAQNLLAEAHAAAMTKSDSYMVRRISALLQNTIILLSTTAAVKNSTGHSDLATVAVDMGHNITWRREQKTLGAAPTSIVDDQSSGSKLNASRRCSTALTSDMAKFQRSYIEMVPKSWSVVSVSLSDSQHDLCITKFQAGHSPFILRLPLERANSRDADTEVYNFAHGKEELLEIIRLANETSHSARDFSQKGERNAWWAEREALDTRLKDLLVQIETTWLGGFKGIFSQHQRRNDLLSRFQKSFQKMLDSHLPSRNRVRGKKSAKPVGVTLDPRILDLFIGLGDPTDPDCDYDEALNDLLYFIVDILQFHGERNAYDEIDFDAMVVEMYDALRGYYSALEGSGKREDAAHTILVLDKSLHAFPWESLPCMEGLAVSRVPSLACLRQMITESNPCSASSSQTSSPSGHYVSATAGTYMLNPSSDLKNTQAFFQKPFTALGGWNGIVNKKPEEPEFEQALTESQVLLYFGHGSGAQYIRGKTIRRLPKCKPATFLMGCSSAALTEAGEFECYGPVWNYMMAGCPAVVGTLWDVTDRDIDRFAGRTFEEWGLFRKGTFKDSSKNKGRGSNSSSSGDDEEEDEFLRKPGSAGEQDGEEAVSASLVEAVARARDACRFRYLNAAAVVVYGVPVYIERDVKGKSKGH